MHDIGEFPVTVHTITEQRVNLTADDLEKILARVLGFKGELLAYDAEGKEMVVRYRYRKKDATEALVEPKLDPPAPRRAAKPAKTAVKPRRR